MKTNGTQEKETLGLVWLLFEIMHKSSLLPYTPPEWNNKKKHLSPKTFSKSFSFRLSALGIKSVPYSTMF